jgi:methylated-DNA-[protein]-cysteine S-methyltransferase
MNRIDIQFFKTPYGELVLGAFEGKLCLCDWRYRKMRSAVDGRISRGLNAEFVDGDAPVLGETKRQLTEYFRTERNYFELPLMMVGGDFQKRVWDELLKVGYGETASYLALAERMGNKNAVRAVAGANGANAISIIVPCHRIVGSKGELVGYAGGLKVKEKLLALECGLFALI